MTTSLRTTLKIASWVEEPTRELGDDSRLSHARVELVDGADGLDHGWFESLLHYRADGSSTFVSVLHLAGTLDGRTGSFVALGEGTYDGTTAQLKAAIVSGSGTEALTGIGGIVRSESRQADYPNMPIAIEYTFD